MSQLALRLRNRFSLHKQIAPLSTSNGCRFTCGVRLIAAKSFGWLLEQIETTSANFPYTRLVANRSRDSNREIVKHRYFSWSRNVLNLESDVLNYYHYYHNHRTEFEGIAPQCRVFPMTFREKERERENIRSLKFLDFWLWNEILRYLLNNVACIVSECMVCFICQLELSSQSEWLL